MNLQSFKAHIKTVPHSTLDTYFAEITEKAARAKAPAVRLGYAMALDELVIESNMRRTAVAGPVMSDDELLAALTA